MTKVFKVLCSVFFVLALTSAMVSAAEKATRDECVEMAKKAASVVNENGLEGAMARVQDSDEFIWKDSYVFFINTETGQVVVHPITPKLVGKTLTGLKDVTGKMFFVEMINVAKNNGEGWVDYMWPKPGEKKPSPKLTYVYKVPGQDLLAAAGIYK